jgi:hypothetical protein
MAFAQLFAAAKQAQTAENNRLKPELRSRAKEWAPRPELRPPSSTLFPRATGFSPAGRTGGEGRVSPVFSGDIAVPFSHRRRSLEGRPPDAVQ